MIKAIAHICISANDLNKTEDFYCRILGLKKKFNFIKDGKVIGFYVQVGQNNFLEFFLSDMTSQTDSPLVKHFCLEVDDIQKTIEQIRSAGAEVSDKKMGSDSSWQAWITDPNGVRIELHEYTDKSSQIVGSDCIV